MVTGRNPTGGLEKPPTMQSILTTQQYHAAKALMAGAIHLVEIRNRGPLASEPVGLTLTLGDASVSLTRDAVGALYKAQVDIRNGGGTWTAFASAWDSAALTALHDCEYALDGRHLGYASARTRPW